MNAPSAKTLLALTATAVLALPAVAQASQGADGPVGHVRRGATEVHHHHADNPRHGADDTPGDLDDTEDASADL